MFPLILRGTISLSRTVCIRGTSQGFGVKGLGLLVFFWASGLGVSGIRVYCRNLVSGFTGFIRLMWIPGFIEVCRGL